MSTEDIQAAENTEVVAETIAPLEEATDTTATDLEEVQLEHSIEEIEQMMNTAEQTAAEQAHLQLAINVSNIILNQTDFLKLVTRHTTNAIIHASAMYKQNGERPTHVITRENLETHTFIMDIHSIDPQNPLSSQFTFVYLQPGFDRNDPKGWVAESNISVESASLLVAQAIDLKAKVGDRFYGRTYIATPATNEAPDIFQELTSGGEDPAVIISDAPSEVLDNVGVEGVVSNETALDTDENGNVLAGNEADPATSH